MEEILTLEDIALYNLSDTETDAMLNFLDMALKHHKDITIEELQKVIEQIVLRNL